MEVNEEIEAVHNGDRIREPASRNGPVEFSVSHNLLLLGLNAPECPGSVCIQSRAICPPKVRALSS